MLSPQEQAWLDALRQHVQTKPCVILRLSLGDSDQLLASRHGLSEFTLARSHELCAGISTKTICFIFGESSEYPGISMGKPEKFAYVGIITSRNPVTTLETRIKVKRAVSMSPGTESAVCKLLKKKIHATNFRKKLQSTDNVITLSPKLSGYLLDKLAEINANHGWIHTISEVLAAPSRYVNFSAVQEDAVRTALKAFKISSQDYASDIELVNSRPTALARVPLMEDSVIEHDARTVPGYTLTASDITGRAIFEKGGERLEVFTANRRDLEHVFGVDLIYLNLTKKNIVMVQYKMLEQYSPSECEAEWVYRPDANMNKEIKRMQIFSAACQADPLEYRLNPEVFYLKLVRRDGRLTSGSIIIPISHYSLLVKNPVCKGSRGGLRINYNTLGGHYIRQGTFLDLIQSGYIGAFADTTAKLNTLVEAVLNGNRAVVAAVQSRLERNHPAIG
ncbi:hypothetical protein [Azotobacter beijerinckii]|uniref:Uncharacterized protein n=1 Tax=Azotobacter beijerinckii TaxID=170623 RepID=A0A1I1A5M8_9GAMM|nr:hypothetical protein [Azotobacter beijerinckii]SFB31723.1 hypothetical protein SAMN04244571_02226 [Azotobacter beijerinckii]